MRSLTLLSLAATTCMWSACSFPSFQATKTIEFSVPAASLTSLVCTSHNGHIVVDGDPAATQVMVKAELTVRGETQEEANANLNLLEIGQEQNGSQLKLWGKYPTGTLVNRSPSFAFTMQVPANMQLELESHNGDLTVRGTDGALRMETHNGDIEAKVATSKVEVETHNGTVTLDLTGSGKLDGSVTSHNGGITIGLASAIHTTVEAGTHNGSVKAGANAAEASSSKKVLTYRIGDGSGKLLVSTHNGSVNIR